MTETANTLINKALTNSDRTNLAQNLAPADAKPAKQTVDFAEIVEVWPDLPEYIKQSIKALVDAFKVIQKQE